MPLDAAKLDPFMGRFVNDMGAVAHAATVLLGDRVGLYRAMADGVWMIVEPFANDQLENNLTPVGRIFYSASTFICTPASRAQEVGLALGAQAGEKRLRDVVREAGFARFQRVAETPFNLVFDVRP